MSAVQRDYTIRRRPKKNQTVKKRELTLRMKTLPFNTPQD